ncbi:IQ motif and SEC7 domain-containing protein 3 isoform X2 [Acipenser ruthenus]|uniref:IQ motif and SEC7 domain-containing protein 3 isoform X2 n=1 Tax=Acipenser ruthenus TaxID=7906 RepID=UPI002741B69F|nr:IQ motif and SEC7 domain-containing protein 3 isoform X2 [Acipenser ruthenus]
MESLLDNPMKAVLYLKELTTIVQNQQSLIQTQRQRIDELERKVEELIGENRNLKDKPQPQTHHYHHHPSQRSTSPQPPAHLHQYPASKATATVAASTRLTAQLQPPQQHQQPLIPPQQSQTPEHPLPETQPQQQLQLVPASPPTPLSPQSPQPSRASPEPAEAEKNTPCCKSLVPQKPAAICRAVVLGRKPKNETVLHQFCCPAADADQKADSSNCSTSDSMPASCAPGEAGETAGGGGQEEDEEEAGTMPSGVEGGVGCRGGVKASLHHTASPMRVQRNKGASACSHSSTSDYELSLDLKNKQIEMLEHKYGGHLISRRAACTIQTAFRQYQLSKNFEKIRNSLLESRLPHRISLRKLRVHNTEGFSTEKALVEGYNFMGIPLVRSPSLPTTISGALTELEDSFTEQVQSLAKSIDDALSTWSLKTMCSLQDVGTYQFTETFRTAASGLGAGSVEAGESGGQESSVEEARPDALPHSGSTLMMAFRDVTVQIDNQNFCMSSSLMESTSLSLSNCLQQGGLEAKDAVEREPELKEGPQDLGEDLNEFPAPPPSEEEEVEPLLALQKVESAEPVVEVKTAESEMADNSSEQTSSSSTSTSAKSASEASSKEALQAMILSLPRYHCENPASCKSPTLSTDVMRKRLYRIGLNLFNVNPDKGIQFLISRGFIPDTPIGVAHFLLQRKGLSRQMIGEFLGNSKKQFNRDVLDCVVDEMDFYGMELDEALRKFQAHIRVQGEAQKVERLIEAFSQRYCICNPDVVQQFHNPDTIFILAFAIILLNTDMYSPNIKPDRKMMLEDFIRNLRGVDDGADIPREMVVGIYERIQQRELRSNEDHVTYVTKVEQSILGMKTVLSVPHRRLVCCSRLFEVIDVNKAQKQAAHQREVFLFNDLMVILKLCPKKKSSATYTFCKAVGLQGMQFHLFENEYYPHGITLVSPYSGSDKKQVLHFCAQSAEELLKFVEDLKESIGEVTEMEQIRIEWELEKQQGTKTKNNGTQLELRGKQQGSPPGTQTHRAAGLSSRQARPRKQAREQHSRGSKRTSSVHPGLKRLEPPWAPFLTRGGVSRHASPEQTCPWTHSSSASRFSRSSSWTRAATTTWRPS